MNVLLAGVDSKQKVKWVETALPARPPKIHLLTSIVQHNKTKSSGANSLRNCLEAMHAALDPCDVLLDSGAHSFHQRFRRGERIKIDEARRFRDRYVETVLTCPLKPNYMVELDLQMEFGIDVIDRWRDEVWQAVAQETGIEILYVWSPLDGWAGYQSLIKRKGLKYIGLAAGAEIMRSGTPAAQALIRGVAVDAYQRQIKTHLFKATSIALMQALPVYSVDSISWKSAALWGLSLFSPAEGKMSFTRIGQHQAKDPLDIDKLLHQGLSREWFDFDNAQSDSGSKRAVTGKVFLANLKVLWQVERNMTDLWRTRGVVWQ